MDDKLLQIFSEESAEIIEALENGLMALEDHPEADQLNAVFRAAHTMKGNAGIVGFEDVVDLTHLMEGVLDEMRQGVLAPGPETVGVLLSSVDALKVLINGHLEDQQAAPPPVEVMASLARLLGEAPPEISAAVTRPREEKPGERSLPGPTLYHITMRFDRDLFLTGTDPLQLILELEELGEIVRVVCHTGGLPVLDEINPDELYFWWEVWLSTQEPKSSLDNVFIFVQDDNDITVVKAEDTAPAATPTESSPRRPGPAPKQAAARTRPAPAPAAAVKATAPPVPETAPSGPPAVLRAATPASTIRVETDKLDKLVNLVGELVIGVARMHQIAEGAAISELDSAVEALEHISRDLQEQVMRVRMIPVEGTFNRFQRVVRDLAGELGKKIRLEMSGTETELDKNVIEQIADPLKHLIRNSADHGLESPEARLAAGKTDTGTIWLRAYQQEGKIIIEVADDGRGISRERVLAKAVERGLISPGSTPCDDEIFSCMFRPGFSTAQKVTEVSGRGVGLDVVRQNIESLRGSVEVMSTEGRGATFRIKLPLTLAIIDGMTVRVGEDILTLPMLSILESIRPKPEEVKTVEGAGELIVVRGEYLPLVRLYKVFDLPTERTDPTKALVVIIESVSKRFGVLVDDILGEQQAVIKSLEQNYQKVQGVAGATILGDGRVSLILDIHGLEKLAFG